MFTRTHVFLVFGGILALAAVVAAAGVLLASPARAATPVYADTGGFCAGLTPCFSTIQEAVDSVDAGGTVFVFPGTYAESVDLGTAAGGLSLISVDATGAPTPATVTIAPGSGEAIDTTIPNTGDVTIDGFTLLSPDNDGLHLEAANATLANLTASDNGDNGIFVDVTGNITVTDSTANDNSGGADPGFELIAGGDVNVTNSSASGNEDGFNMGVGGILTITDATANGNVENGFSFGSGPLSVTGSEANNNTLSGFNFGSDDATFADTTANGNGEDGFNFGSGALTVTGSVANDNGRDGFDFGSDDATFTNVTANGNVRDGFDFGSNALVVSNVTANDNGRDGFDFGSDDATFTNTTANGNTRNGFNFGADNLTVSGSQASNNTENGFSFGAAEVTITGTSMIDNGINGITFGASGTPEIAGGIICGNTTSGITNPDLITDGTANWWGDASGPTHPNNAAGTGDSVLDADNSGSGTVNFDPWIDTINASGDPATATLPSTVAFQFASADGSAFLAEGAGPFTVTTDNGAVSPTTGFVNAADGTLEVTLTPSDEGTATVTVTGPCGLDDGLGGNSITLNVAAAPVGPTPTPTPAAPSELPDTGAPPASDSGLPWLALLVAIGAAGVTGGAVAAMRRR